MGNCLLKASASEDGLHPFIVPFHLRLILSHPFQLDKIKYSISIGSIHSASNHYFYLIKNTLDLKMDTPVVVD
jgi:hypothetical protein